MKSAAENGARAPRLAVVVLMLVAVAGWLRYGTPSPRPADAPAELFSAVRAGERLRELTGEERPRPVGSAAHREFRQGLIAVLSELGYVAEVQEGIRCHLGDCARLHNVVARREGREPGPAVLLMAHYDSVPASPGASDDGLGVAAMLEIARVLVARPALRHDVILLFDDGEEPGLLGARLFAEEHPAAADVRVVVNLEARGSSGPSLMFETGPGNAGLMPVLRTAVPRPITSSVFATVYGEMPNMTSFGVFRDRGVRGFNFAILERPQHYHSPRDTLENLSLPSLQHLGDNALGAVVGLAESPLADGPREAGALEGHGQAGDAVFFDLLGLGPVWWPEGASTALAGLALILVLAVAVLARRRHGLTVGGAVLGLFAWLVMVVAILVAAGGLTESLDRLGLWTWSWVAWPGLELGAFWGLCGTCVAALAALVARRCGFWGLWAGVWLGWSAGALALAASLAGLSFLLLVPALVAGLSGLWAVLRPSPAASSRATVPAMAAAALVTLPLFVFLYAGLGAPGLPATGILAGAVATTLAPLAADPRARTRRRFVAAAAGLTAVLLLLSWWVPPYSEEAPQRLNVSFYQEIALDPRDPPSPEPAPPPEERASWLVPADVPLAGWLQDAADFGAERRPGFPWFHGGRHYEAPAPALAVAPPELEVLETAGEGRRWTVRARLRSPRGAPDAAIYFPPSAEVDRVVAAGHPVEDLRDWPSGWQTFRWLTLPPRGLEVELTFDRRPAGEILVVDRTFGLPDAAGSPASARPRTAMTTQDGDQTLVGRWLRLDEAPPAADLARDDASRDSRGDSRDAR